MYETLKTWLAAHPVVEGILLALLVPLFGSFVTWVTWQRTPAAWAIYQAEHPYRAWLIRFCRAVFPHLRKLPQLAPFFPPDDPTQKPVTVQPPERKGNGETVQRLGMLAVIVLFLVGCPRPIPQTPREMVRGYLAVMGLGAQKSVDFCARVGTRMNAAGNADGVKLLKSCADGYDVARSALFAIEAGLDTWQESDAGKLGCAAGSALEGLTIIYDALRERGIALPQSDSIPFDDAMRMASWALRTYSSGGVCAVKVQ